MKNEKGYVLVLVLLIIVIFSVLGLSILSVTINTAQRTVIENKNLQTYQDAIREMEVAIAKIKVEINNRAKYPLDIGKISTVYDPNLRDFILTLNTTNMTVEDKTDGVDGEFKSLSIPRTTHFNRALLITYNAQGENGIEKTITRKVFISAYPSFLNYVAGSRGMLNLNGAVQLKGNIHAADFNIQNLAEYMDITSLGSSTGLSYNQTDFPSIEGKIFITNELFMADKPSSTTTLRSLKVEANKITTTTINRYPSYFYDPLPESDPNYIPAVYPEKEDFIDVNFLSTFIQKFNLSLGLSSSAGYGESNFADISSINNVIHQVISNNCSKPILDYDENVVTPLFNGWDCDKENFFLIEQDWNHDDIALPNNFTREDVILFTNINRGPNRTDPITIDDSGILTISQNLSLDEDAWLIVHGDLVIESFDRVVEISGNILVTGDIIIQGDDEASGLENDTVKFDSTIYTLGEGLIHNTSIKGLEDLHGNIKQVVLLTRENLNIYRINEFVPIPSDPDDAALEGYFYTDKNADLYGVGSLFIIKGGLFAQDSLTINAVRGNVTRSGDQLVFIEPANPDESRFYVIYDEQVITDQLDSLPLVQNLRLVLEDYKIE